MDKNEYLRKQSEAMRGLSLKELSDMQGTALGAVPEEELKKRQMAEYARGDYENMYGYAMEIKRLKFWDTVEQRYVKPDSLVFDHLGEGRPTTLRTEGKEWVISRYRIEIEFSDEKT